MTTDTPNAEGQGGGGQTPSTTPTSGQLPTDPAPTPPDRSWIEFDIGLRNQDPRGITRKG